MPEVTIRPATEADLAGIAAIAAATGQPDDWGGANPAYIRHLMAHGEVLVAQAGQGVAGFGATERIGTGPDAPVMLCDLFVDPAAHGQGLGRALLRRLWLDPAPRLTFSSLHANAIPLYTSFGLDAWWPLLYLRGEASWLARPPGWQVIIVAASLAAAIELGWTGADRTADYLAWATAGGIGVQVSLRGTVLAAGVVTAGGAERGLQHLAVAPGTDDQVATAAVLSILAALDEVAPPRPEPAGASGRRALACLPAPHPAVRPLLAAGWRFDEFDLFMATDPGLLEARRAVLSPAQA
jgi:GNAT superfamily N-acetyltransferase